MSRSLTIFTHNRVQAICLALFFTWISVCLLGCVDPVGEPSVGSADKQLVESVVEPEVSRNPLKNAYFGDLHIHTSWSLDAFAFGVRVGPEDAYRYVRG